MALADPDHRRLRHSRVVGILKVVLPLVALALLSLVFLAARTIDPREAISLAEIDVEDRARDPRLSGARFAGVTNEGSALILEAETARSDASAALRLEVTGLELSLEGPDGETTTARAATGAIDRGAGRFEMQGVEIRLSPGYTLQSERLTGLLDSTRLSSPGPVSGTGPAGTFSAGRMDLSAESASGGAYRLVFSGGVRLNYEPQN